MSKADKLKQIRGILEPNEVNIPISIWADAKKAEEYLKRYDPPICNIKPIEWYEQKG